LAAGVAGAFFMAGASAYILLRHWNKPAGDGVVAMARKALPVALVFGLVASILTAFPTGHEHAKQVARLQKSKFAAIEGLYQSQSKAPLVFFALPFTEPPRLKAKVELKGMLSWMAFGDVNAHIDGIEKFGEDIPPLWLTFVSFHNMVILGMFFIAATAYGVVQWFRGKLFSGRRFLWLLVMAIPLPLAACQLGWIVAEVGRQPWIVWGVMRTGDAFSPAVSAGQVLFSLILFTLIYLALGGLYVFLFFHKLNQVKEAGSLQTIVNV
jgi:cytochrome d ubiquinol oxidase subunit I